ncbi:hypothetical protein K0M31_017679 [Melipona bicolor]|uniref:Uncharacterized protein n=1 Tax=Melipona bicolor TaxID=60889 RepID=A0AA40G5R1_9HYME|nr:hypothetical protein K0M31_017679 [Melipona bicolor]
MLERVQVWKIRELEENERQHEFWKSELHKVNGISTRGKWPEGFSLSLPGLTRGWRLFSEASIVARSGKKVDAGIIRSSARLCYLSTIAKAIGLSFPKAELGLMPLLGWFSCAADLRVQPGFSDARFVTGKLMASPRQEKRGQATRVSKESCV